jgi:GT2 family glycosyltransferase
LVERMEQRPDAGFCGSTLLYYYDPAKVQALGGSIFNSWTARGGHIGNGRDRDENVDRESVERELRYVVGASTLVRREVLEEVGLMNESYFLFYEEIDWAFRAEGKFALAYAPESVVYHKEGASIGSATKTVKQSVTAEFYMTRNRLLLTRSTMPKALPTVTLCVIVSLLHRAILGHFENAHAVFRGAIAGFRVNVRERCGN